MIFKILFPLCLGFLWLQLPQTWWLQTTGIYSLTILEARICNQGVEPILEALGESPFLAFPASGGCQFSLAYGLISPCSVFMLPSLRVCLRTPASLKKIHVIALKAH